MKKKCKVFILSLSMIFILCNCGSEKNVDIDSSKVPLPKHELSSDETIELPTDSLEDVTKKEDSISNESEESITENIVYVIDAPEENLQDSYEMQDWQMKYTEYIEPLEFEYEINDWLSRNTYSLIYVNGDEIPELVIDTGSEAGGCMILTYQDGEIDVLQTSRLFFKYMETENLLDNADGHMGYYYDLIYTIEDGKWVSVAVGEYSDWDDEYGYTEEFRYTWNSQEVTENIYEKNLQDIFDMDLAKVPERYYVAREMLSILKTGRVTSDMHRYEFYIEDITWDVAKARCEEKGGYLATLMSVDELEKIQEGITDSGQTDVCFWVGAALIREPSEYFGFCWLEPKEYIGKYELLDYYNALWFWASDQPDYSIESEGVKIDENAVYIAYDDEKNKCLLYDAPSDICSVYPEFTGKIGYICEYDE